MCLSHDLCFFFLCLPLTIPAILCLFVFLLPLFLLGFISSLPQLAWDKRLCCCYCCFINQVIHNLHHPETAVLSIHCFTPTGSHQSRSVHTSTAMHHIYTQEGAFCVFSSVANDTAWPSRRA
jgi:hypothetical protein